MLLVIATNASAQYKTTEHITSEHYASGQLLRITKEVIKQA